jgi:PKD repeat protein
VYLGTGPIYTAAITLDATGQPYVGDFNFNPIFTNSSNPSDGYNLMANPYPSTIDWLSPAWTKTNIDDAIYSYQADNNQYASFVDGISTNGGSRYIASSQGFFVQANAPGAVLTISENAKSSANPKLIRETNPQNLLILTLSGNYMSDETAIHLNSEATNYFDSKYDALKFYSPNSLAPSITSIIDGKDASINSIPFDAKTISIPIKAKVGVDGMYTLAWSGLGEFAEGTCIVLEDIESGVKTDLVSKNDYTFKAKASDRNAKARFVIHISTPLKQTTAASYCNNSNDGSITLQNPYRTVCKVELSDINNAVLKDATFSDASYTFSGLKSGTYKVTYLEASQCEVMVQTVTIEATKNVTAKFELGSSPVYTGNLISFKSPMNKGNSYSWDFGDGNSETGTSAVEHQYSNEGTYVVTLTNTNGECKDSRSLILNVLNPKAAGASYMDVQMMNDCYYAVFNFDSVITAHISVARLTGQVVIPTQTFVGNNGKVKIDIDDEEQGIYLITLRSGNKIVSKKIIK